jgi:uncharacterized membrane protein
MKTMHENNNNLKSGTIAAKDGRLPSLDYLRGIIMVLMAIDHASIFIAKIYHGEFWGIALPQYDDTLPFLTRWITHICAPGFFFLMGAGMMLLGESRRKAGWAEIKIMRFFVIRGLLLILLQLFVENPAWFFGTLSDSLQMVKPPGGGNGVMLHFGVLYGLGATMIVWALFLRFRLIFVVLLSICSIFFTQWLTPGTSEATILYSPILRLILIPGQTGIWQVFYPVIPWLGLTGFGIVFGKSLLQNRDKAYRIAFIVGITFLLLFIAIRLMGGFGNFHSSNNGWISFLNVTKYPPSLSFIFVTLGIVFLILFLLSRMEHRLDLVGRPFIVFGRAALFFYLVHLYLYLLIGFAFPGGTSYPILYLFWFIGLFILFPLCLWYGRFKRKKPVESIWRFF